MYNPLPDLSFFLPIGLFILGGLIAYTLCYVDEAQTWINAFEAGIEHTIKVLDDDRIGDADMSPNELLKECRKKKGYTIKHLAEESGVAAQTIINIEANKVNSRLDTFNLLFEAMGYEITIIEKRYPHGKPSN